MADGRVSAREFDKIVHDKLIAAEELEIINDDVDEYRKDTDRQGNNEEERYSLVKDEIGKVEYFSIFQSLTQQVTDLKEYLAFEISNLKQDKSTELLDKLRNENKLLRSELQETRSVINNILLNINTEDNFKRREQSTENKHSQQHSQHTQLNNEEWLIPKRTFNKITQKDTQKSSIELKNCFDQLYVESINRENGDAIKPVFLNKEIKENGVQDDRSLKCRKVSKNSINGKSLRGRPSVVVNRSPDKQHDFRNKQATENRTYSKTVPASGISNRIKIFSDSIPKNIKMRKFNSFIRHGRANLKVFTGATAKRMNHYVIPTLAEETLDAVIIHVGINDLLSKKEEALNEKKLVEEIIKIGERFRACNVEDVFVSGITYSSKVDTQTLNRVNYDLQIRCKQHGFIFIDNANIEYEHLWKDGIHLRASGNILLANNLIDSLNNFFRAKYCSLNPP